MNQLNLIIILFFTIYLSAQSDQIIIHGKITNDSVALENIHIINTNSKKGAITNNKGVFQIPVKLNDTLIFSGIQFYSKKLQITKQIIKNKFIQIDLFQKINTLAEVEIKAHDLYGNLTIDSKNFIDTIHKANPFALNYRKDYKAISNSVAKKLDPDYLPDVTDPMVPIGGDLIGLTLFLLKPLIKEVSKIGKTKREINNKERIYQIKAKTAPEDIRIEFGDDFFIKTLNIPLKQIDAFIIYCEPKDIIHLFLKGKKLEMFNVFLMESKSYKYN